MKLTKIMIALTLGVSMLNLSGLQAKASTLITDNDLSSHGTKAPAPWGAVPDANQYRYQEDELAAFVHFGMNTYTGSEWGTGKESPSQFKLKKFDAETLVKTAHDAGFKKIIVTAKHHDGFCIWPSKYTDHDTEAAGYKGDILAEISAQCTKYNMDMGLYLSPWDENAPSYGYYDAQGNPLVGSDGKPLNGMSWDEVKAKDALDYNEYYNNQLTEILSNKKYGNNGKFVEVWMDGAKGGGADAQNYDFQKWFHTIQKYQGKEAGRDADCMLFGANSYTTVRWIGNENGLANEETWSKSNINRDLDTIDSNTQGEYTIGYENGNQWTVPECDGRITSGWFWGENKKTPKTLSDLSNMYFNSVGHNATMLLNIPPNKEGTLDQDIIDRVDEFGDNIKETFSNNMAASTNANVSAAADEVRGNDIAYKPGNVLDGSNDTYWTVNDGTKTGSITIDLGSLKTFDVVSLQEAIQYGQRIKSFKVEYLDKDGTWQTMQEGTTIGAKRLVRTKAVRGSKVRVTLTTSQAPPMLTNVGVYKASSGFELAATMPEGLENIDIDDKDTSDGKGFDYSGWTRETGNQFVNGTNVYANTGAEMTLKFHGTKAYLIGTKDPNHGTADIYIDGKKVKSIDTSATSRSIGQNIFESDTLADGEHTLRLVVTSKAIGVEAAYVLDNGGAGMFELAQKEYSMYEDSSMDVTIKRIGGSKGEATVILQDNPGTAVQGDYYTTEGLKLDFKDGETEKSATIRTKRDPKVKGNIFFTLELVEPSNHSIVGFNGKAKVVIKDLDTFTKADLQTLYDTYAPYQEGLYKEGWAAFDDARTQAKAVLAKPDAVAGDYGSAYVALETAAGKLVIRDQYTKEDPYVFPSVYGKTSVLEAELSQLINTGEGEEWPLQISSADWASDGKFVNCLNTNDKIVIPYTAKEAGTYKVTATYRSGDVNNALQWTEKNNNIEAGSVIAGADDAAGATHTVTFDMKVNKPGPGELVFTGPQKNSPQLDKFDIELKDAAQPADTKKLQDLVNQVNKLEEKDYTADSWKKLQSALQTANDVLHADKTTQSQVDGAVDQLHAAVDALAKVEDTTEAKTILKAAIDKAEALKQASDYDKIHETVRALLDKRLAEAQTVYANTDATKSEIMSAWTNLSGVLQLEDFKADKSALQALYDKYKDVDTDKYISGTKELAKALENAKSVLDNENALQPSIDQAFDELNEAYAGLVEKPATTINKTTLKELIDKAQTAVQNATKYNTKDDSWKLMVDTLGNATAIYNDDKATQTAIDAITIKLANAYMNIRMLPDASISAQFNTFLQIAQHIDRSQYSAANLAKIDAIVNEVKACISKGATEKEYQELSLKIKDAMQIIQNEKLTSENKPKEPTKVDEHKNTANKVNAVNTGDITNVAGFIMLIIIAAGAGIFLIRKQKKQIR